MNFVGDESLDHPIVLRLRAAGHDVLSVTEMDPGITDDEVLDLANRNGAVLVTADKDFCEMVFRLHRVTAGVVLVRLAGLSAEQKADIVAAEVERHLDQLTGAFTVIAPGSVRVRRRLP